MPKSRKSHKGGRKRSSRSSSASIPRMFSAKKPTSMILGWQLSLPAGSLSDFSFAITLQDVMFAVAICSASVTGNAVMNSLFSAVRLRKVEMWELDGNPISLSWSAGVIATPFVPGPDLSKADTGTTLRPSHVWLTPRRGSLVADWFQSNSSSINLVAGSVVLTEGTGSASPASRLVVRVSIDYTLNDAFAYATTYTTAASQTLVGGLMYWRNLVLSGNGTKCEVDKAIATYAP